MSDTFITLTILTVFGFTYAGAAIAWAHWEGRRLDKLDQSKNR
ncbi:hypothetical protein [Roseivivax sediminis]|uniref:Uncharacterized protein n=1 Tax=Roseivivax sediminis TaxID=936889 RepID=A0A1I2CPI1_9RHOB|nr:hypothetical protein [Roseivivax sediminis]SFE69670.1 hypothetical protein SAMN04515678_11412 [Roseivivax sediminis]